MRERELESIHKTTGCEKQRSYIHAEGVYNSTCVCVLKSDKWWRHRMCSRRGGVANRSWIGEIFMGPSVRVLYCHAVAGFWLCGCCCCSTIPRTHFTIHTHTHTHVLYAASEKLVSGVSRVSRIVPRTALSPAITLSVSTTTRQAHPPQAHPFLLPPSPTLYNLQSNPFAYIFYVCVCVCVRFPNVLSRARQWDLHRIDEFILKQTSAEIIFILYLCVFSDVIIIFLYD